MLHDLLVAPPVGLGAEGVNGRALAQIQHTVLDTGLIRRLGHLTAESVQLPDQMALSRAADGRVAGHVAHTVQIHGKA